MNNNILLLALAVVFILAIVISVLYKNSENDPIEKMEETIKEVIKPPEKKIKRTVNQIVDAKFRELY